jgi:hypothetical protein
MSKAAIATVVGSALCISGCQGVVLWGNLAVFGVSVGIFLGTLALGRNH